MTRLAETLADLRRRQRKALITFITAGDPDLQATVPALHALVRGGADVLELGVPFSDPEAEGPAIQKSSERALAQGTTLAATLEMVAQFRQSDLVTPIVLMGYLNSVMRMGFANFAERASRAGVDGLIMVNLPPEEAEAFIPMLSEHNIDLIFLVAPTTTDERRGLIAQHAQGFMYYVSLKGITGADHLSTESVAENVTALRAHTDLPVMVGFGIKDGSIAQRVAAHADGVVIGSALVNTMANGSAAQVPQLLQTQVAEIRNALDSPMDVSG